MKTSFDQPNKANIKRLLDHILSSWDVKRVAAPTRALCESLEKEYADLTREFNDSPRMKSLALQLEEARNQSSLEEEAYQKKLNKLRREFYAKGATPAVLKKVQDFVDEINAN